MDLEKKQRKTRKKRTLPDLATNPEPSATEPKPSATEPKPSATEPKPSATNPEPSATKPLTKKSLTKKSLTKPSATNPEPSATEPIPSATEPKPLTMPSATEEYVTNSIFDLKPSTIQNKLQENPVEDKFVVDYPNISPQLETIGDSCRETNNPYSKECNRFLFEKEKIERKLSLDDENDFLYPTLNNINFNVKIAEKKEFQQTKYNGKLHEITDDLHDNQVNFERYTQELIDADFELAPHQNFVRNYLSFQTPYNSLLLFHGLGSGKTLTAIGIAEEMRDYLKKMGINKKIIIVASPNVQDNFKLQLFDERRLQEPSSWIMNDVVGNKILKEVNPLNSRISREDLLKQVNKLINSYYSFFGYIQFANYIEQFTHKDDTKQTIKNLQNEFNNSLIIIDEIQNMKNINDSKGGENKKNIASTAFQNLVKAANNLRLLFLTATPMFNSCEEIIWILNMMNMNDRRSIMKISDIFDKNENLKEESRELLVQKATGYVSFVRGENPYTFPFRVYPTYFASEHTFEHYSVPTLQMNGKTINNPTEKILGLYLTELQSYQSKVYNYIIKKLFDNQMFVDFSTFNYTILQPLIQCLIISYPTLDNNIEEVSLEEYYSSPEESTPEKSSSEESTPEESSPEESTPEESSPEESSPEESSPEESSIQKGGMVQEPEESDVSEESYELDISYKDLIGTNGLKNIMNYEDTATKKENFRYKHDDPNYHIFKPDKIGNYSSKIKNICENIYNSSNDIVSQGIILIYSQYIDSGLIPMALALEELGFKRFKHNSLFDSKYNIPSIDSITFKKIDKRNGTNVPACYTMITGDKKLSPNNKEELKNITDEKNKEGKYIKVILISQAGSEGIDFKYIRQVHILDPWYNINRIEQIIGRAVRNFSHKALPLEQRNVQIFLHGTILPFNKSVEAADLYIYRIAEYKAKQIGIVTRLLKETAVDCILNHNQTNFDVENMRTTLLISLSTLPNEPKPFQVGDRAYTSTCDYMDTCQYQCNPSLNEGQEVNMNTYSEAFIKMNIDKIMNKIRFLFKKKYFYDRETLIKEINNAIIYSQEQINYALTELINEPTELLIDKNGKKGHLVNIGEYYLFQPIDLNDPNISLLNREMPIDDKKQKINIHVDKEYNEYNISNIPISDVVNSTIINKIKSYYDLAMEFYILSDEEIERRETFTDSDQEWKHIYSSVGIVMKNLNNNGLLFNEQNGIAEEFLKEMLIDHIIDFLLPKEKMMLFETILTLDLSNEFNALLQYSCIKKFIDLGDKYAYILYNPEPKYYVTNKIKMDWKQSRASEQERINNIVTARLSTENFNKIVGFIDIKTSIMMFKTKNTFTDAKKIQQGSICEQAGKVNQIKLLNNIIGIETYGNIKQTNKKLRAFFYALEIKDDMVNTKYINKYELCILCEFILRYYQIQQKENKIWFLDYETQSFINFNKWRPT